MIIFQQLNAVGKSDGRVDLNLVFGLVLAVADAPFRLPELNLRQPLIAEDLRRKINDAVDIAEFGGFKSGSLLIAEQKIDAGIDNRLPLHNVLKIFRSDGDIGEYLQIGFPTDDGAGPFPGIWFLVQLAHIFTFFKMQCVFGSDGKNGHVHIFAGILRCAGAESVGSQ